MWRSPQSYTPNVTPENLVRLKLKCWFAVRTAELKTLHYCHYHNLCAQALDDHCWSAALGVVFGGVVAGSCVVAATLVVAGSCVVAAILVVAGRAVVPGCCVLATGKFVVC